MKSKVAIVSTNQIHGKALRQKLLQEVIFETVRGVLEQTQTERSAVDCVVMAAQDVVDGRSLADQLSVGAAGGYYKKATRVCNDGAYAVVLGSLEILSGECELVLVVGWSKCSEDNMSTVTNLQFDPFYLRPIGFNEINSLALQACRYAARFNVTEEDAALVAVRNFKNAQRNPYALSRHEIRVKDVLKSKMLSYPLKELDVCSYSNGACAILLASEEKAKELTDKPVWIHGFGWATDGYYPGDRDLSSLPSLENAAAKAYKMAETKPENLDVIEIVGKSDYHEMMILEALGFCEKGDGKDMVARGETDFGGSIPVNPSGGVMVLNPYVASGLVRVAEVALQLSNEAGGRQVKGAKQGLAHGTSGPFMQNNCVIIMGD